MSKKNFKWLLFISGTLILLCSMLAIGITAYVRVKYNEAPNNEVPHEETDNKPCRYQEYAGVLTVEEIRSNPSKNAAKDMLIIYQFDPGNENNPPHVKKDGGQIETTAAEIKRLDIKPGKQFQTKAEYIISGYCRPGPYVKDLNTWK